MKNVSTEEAWGILRRNGYNNQFVGDWVQVHPGKILVGRAVTTVFIPHRPDFHALVEEKGKDRRADWRPELLGDRHAGARRCAGGRYVRQGQEWHLYR